MSISDRQIKRLDLAGAGLLSFLMILSFLLRIAPDQIMDPGFPVLSRRDFTGAFLSPRERGVVPIKLSNVYDFNQVSYYSYVNLYDEDYSLSVYQTIIRYPDPTAAAADFQAAYDEYLDEISPKAGATHAQKLVTDIPGLEFTSRADRYHLWCEQWAPLSGPQIPGYDGEEVSICYYLSVYGRYYSNIRTHMIPRRSNTDSTFPLDLFNEALSHADRKLSSAR